MYLKSMKLGNYRKFGCEDNVIGFVDSNTFRETAGEPEKINIAKTTTLIVGKNNVGKTTVISALQTLIKGSGIFTYTDINFRYLRKLFDEYTESLGKGNVVYPIPSINFTITVGLEENSKDIINNLAPFMTIGSADDSELNIKVMCEIDNNDIFEKLTSGDVLEYEKFIDCLKECKFKARYFSSVDDPIKDFQLSSLIDMKSVNANNVSGDHCLSSAFNKIVNYRVNKLNEGTNLEDDISKFNNVITGKLRDEHTVSINASVGAIESAKHIRVHLKSDATFEGVMKDIVKYEYVERGLHIPENQFGLGYTKLMMIIAELIDYIERYPVSSFNSRINLISIEEPETHMHPQMQENFVKSINDAIIKLLQGKDKKLNSQLIITTHSSNILNSKIHSGSSFDYINYMASIDNESKVICLKDDVIKPSGGETPEDNLKDFEFLKKHIKYKVSELFFSDAVIFVEGITEEVLLNYYVDHDESLNKFYISIFNIDGAHGLVYHNLIKALKIPTLVITDLDIKRSDKEKEDFYKITSLNNRITTNKTITKYNRQGDDISRIELEELPVNMIMTYQEKCNDVYPTSFEEAFILENHDNAILNQVLKKIKPQIYGSIVKNEGGLLAQSYKLQKKLSNSKSSLANDLLYGFLQENNTENIPKMPKYISEGLKMLSKKLNGGEDGES